jgi:hypothetical protein
VERLDPAEYLLDGVPHAAGAPAAAPRTAVTA